MTRRNTIAIRVDLDDLDKIKKLAAKRVVSGKDLVTAKPRRIIKAMLRIPNIDEIIIKSPFREL